MLAAPRCGSTTRNPPVNRSVERAISVVSTAVNTAAQPRAPARGGSGGHLGGLAHPRASLAPVRRALTQYATMPAPGTARGIRGRPEFDLRLLAAGPRGAPFHPVRPSCGRRAAGDLPGPVARRLEGAG